MTHNTNIKASDSVMEIADKHDILAIKYSDLLHQAYKLTQYSECDPRREPVEDAIEQAMTEYLRGTM